jgi:sarcosine oxidase delta subunit
MNSLAGLTAAVAPAAEVEEAAAVAATAAADAAAACWALLFVGAQEPGCHVEHMRTASSGRLLEKVGHIDGCRSYLLVSRLSTHRLQYTHSTKTIWLIILFTGTCGRNSHPRR